MEQKMESQPGRPADAGQEEADWDRRCREWKLRGWDIRYILTRSGYTVRELAEHMRCYGTRITTIRSVYRLMTRDKVSTRYADVLEDLIGKKHYLLLVKEVIKRYEERIRQQEERRKALGGQ
ncbi:MAG: hypothetical protein JWQ98_344 [Chlorobi bacterium]|nr:hypothetical protein [Chlorobiota bacterium]